MSLNNNYRGIKIHGSLVWILCRSNEKIKYISFNTNRASLESSHVKRVLNLTKGRKSKLGVENSNRCTVEPRQYDYLRAMKIWLYLLGGHINGVGLNYGATSFKLICMLLTIYYSYYYYNNISLPDVL